MESSQITFRIDPEIAEKFDKAKKVTGLKNRPCLEQMIESFSNYVLENDEISFPLVVIPKKEYENMKKSHRGSVTGQVKTR